MLTDKMCYTCLSKQSIDLIDVQKNDIDKISYKQKLTECLSNLEELTSMKMCRSCIKHLRISYDFVKMIRKTQETIKQYLKDANITYMTSRNEEYDKKNNFTGHQSDRTQQNDIYFDKNSDIKDELYESDNSDYFLHEIKNHDTQDDSCNKCDKCGIYTDAEHVCDIKDELIIKYDVSTDEPITEVEEGEQQKVTKKVKHKFSKCSMTESRYECQQCEQIFTKRWQLTKHAARVHGTEKKFVCSVCNRAFKELYHLNEHITKHTGERNYACPICDKTFLRASSQRRHIKAHEAPPGQKTKRTPFLCTICGKSFPFSNGAQRHMQIHLGIKKHECALCKRKFTQSTHLYVHMRTHTGEKPYVCDICGDAFSLNVSFRKHMSVHNSKVKIEILDPALTDVLQT